MHHYCTSGASEIGLNHEIISLWREIVPKLGAEHPFLLHGLLACSAAHLRITEREKQDKWALIYAQHYSLSLPAYREALLDLNQNNAGAAFCMSALCVLLTMANFAISDPTKPTEHSVDDIIQLSYLARGVTETLAPFSDLLHSSPIAVMFNNNLMDDYSRVALPSETQRQIDRLRELSTRYQNHESSNRAISMLEMLYKDVVFHDPANVNEVSMVLRWPAKLPTNFLGLLSQRDPVSMVVLAHYVVISGWVKRWYVEGFGRIAWEVLMKEMSDKPDYAEYLEWPKRQLEENLPSFPAPL